eukprot:jgi/Bigna1/90107/estExt_fgenesh1_pg.C_620085
MAARRRRSLTRPKPSAYHAKENVSSKVSSSRNKVPKGCTTMPSGQDYSSAFVVNMQLLKYETFAAKEKLRTRDLNGRMFDRSNERAMQ